MKKNFIILFSLIISACYVDYLSEIAIIKNISLKDVMIIETPDSLMTDSIFYEQYHLADTLSPNGVLTLTWPNVKPHMLNDSVKEYVFVYDLELVKQLKNEQVEIHKKAMLNRIRIQLNQIRSPLDTIYIK